MKSIISFLLVCNFCIASLAQDAVIRKKNFNLDDGIAIDGYDPVAYFKNSKAIEGDKKLSVYHQGVTYYFSSVENKEEFKKSSLKYEPEYGGWCAYAMGTRGEKVSVDPEHLKL